MNEPLSDAPVVALRCLACSGPVELADRATSCPCGRSSVRPDARGHAYDGPARAMLVTYVTRPGGSLAARETDIADTDALHRDNIEPRI